MSDLVLYTKYNCTNCKLMKNFLDHKEVDYEVRNIDDSFKEEGKEVSERYHILSAPILVNTKMDIAVGGDFDSINKAILHLITKSPE